jgi:hypothetical protein
MITKEQERRAIQEAAIISAAKREAKAEMSKQFLNALKKWLKNNYLPEISIEWENYYNDFLAELNQLKELEDETK